MLISHIVTTERKKETIDRAITPIIETICVVRLKAHLQISQRRRRILLYVTPEPLNNHLHTRTLQLGVQIFDTTR